MSGVAKQDLPRRASATTGLRTQRVDIVASMLMAGLVVIGMLVSLLFLIWLTQTFTWSAGVIQFDEERMAGRGDHAEGFERDIEPPGAEEIEDLVEPTLAETLEAVTEAATTVAASLDSIDSDSSATSSSNARGDSRPPGPLGEGDDIIPRSERWELKFLASGLRPYAMQLDFYQIELGCVGNGITTVDFAYQLANGPKRRSSTAVDENKRARLFFMWRQPNKLMDFERQLLAQAGITTQNRQLLKFIPKTLEDQLYQAEMMYARSRGHNSVKEIAKTIFESKAVSGGGYQFSVLQQRYRTVK